MGDRFEYRSGFELLRAMPVALGVVIEVGDRLKLSGGQLFRVSGTTDNLSFVAVAKEAHSATDPSGEITVALRNANAIYELTLDAATDITIMDELQMNSTTPESVAKKSTTDPVAVAVESKLQATKIRAIYTIPATSAGPTFLGDAS